MTSSWTGRTAPTNLQWYTIAYGNNIFVALSSDKNANGLMTSTDGITWTTRSNPALSLWNKVAFLNNLFIAVASDGTYRLAYSSDGINWTALIVPSKPWYDVTYGNGLYVAISYGSGVTTDTNIIMTSPDAITWTLRTTPFITACTSIAYGNGIFTSVSGQVPGQYLNAILTSTNGIDWSLSGTFSANFTWQPMAFGNGIFVALAYGGGSGTEKIMTSTDGINWTFRSFTGANQGWKSLVFGNGLFVGVSWQGASTANRIMYSTDGITWTSRTCPQNNPWTSVTYGKNLFVSVAYNGTQRIMTATDIKPTFGPFSIPTKTISDSPFTITAPTSNSTGAFSYTSSNTSVATISGSTITIVGGGTSVITANQAQTSSYAPGSTTANFIVSLPAPTLSNFSVPTKTFGNAPFALTAPTSNSSGAFTYSSSNTSVATIAANTVTIVGAGTSIITATQAATASYSSGDISANFVVNQASPTLSNFSVPTKTFGDTPFALTAPTSNSSGAFSYSSSNTSVATIAGSTVTIVGVGTSIITATQAATTNYTTADISANFVVKQSIQNPTLSNFSIDTTSLDYPSFTIPPPTSNSDGIFTYTSSNPAVATISGNIMTIVGPGNTTIIATQEATSSYTSGTISTTFAEYFHLCKNWNFHFHGNSVPYNP